MAKENSAKAQFEHVFEAFKGFQTVQVIHLGLQLGLFSTLNETPQGLTPEDLAARLRLHTLYVQKWCEVAYAYKLLERDNNGFYHLPPKLDTVLLDTDHPRYLGGFANGFFTYGADDFRRYPQAFVEGDVYPFQEHGEGFSAWVSSLTHPMQRLVVGKVLPELMGAEMERGLDILDVGCGAGEMLFKLAAAYPNSRLTGIDSDGHGIKIAQGNAKERGLNHITFVHTNGEHFDQPSAFDLALMFEVFHEIPIGDRRPLLAACYQALRPGGALLIVDETWPDDPTQLRDPAYGFSVMVQFSELIWGNLVATESEQTQLLDEAGFVDIQRGDLGGTFTTIHARKSHEQQSEMK